ncbi:MAG: hypothetical protein LBU26_02115, partial [Synergistaceae bacterium]|nr:hypothetical protein [Synergistaceae bacterium]
MDSLDAGIRPFMRQHRFSELKCVRRKDALAAQFISLFLTRHIYVSINDFFLFVAAIVNQRLVKPGPLFRFAWRTKWF